MRMEVQETSEGQGMVLEVREKGADVGGMPCTAIVG